MFVYSAYCIPSKKTYIGITSNSLSTRITSHKYNSKTLDTHFYNAIRKYGIGNFEFRIIDTATDWKELKILEQIYIDMFGTYFSEIGYNTTHGGDGLFGCNGERNTFYGKRHTEESRQKIREARARQIIKHSLETRKKMSLSAIGKKKSPEAVAKTKETKRLKKIGLR